MCLQLLGSVSFSLKRFSDSLGYLNRANRVLARLQDVGVVSVDDVRPVLHAVQLELANVKNAMGRAGLGSCLLGGLPDWLVSYAARLVCALPLLRFVSCYLFLKCLLLFIFCYFSF